MCVFMCIVEEVVQVISDELFQGFEEFDEEPVGTASLAQVHRARLKDGRQVAVKIQHPQVKAHSFVDMKTMEVRGSLSDGAF